MRCSPLVIVLVIVEIFIEFAAFGLQDAFGQFGGAL